MRKQPEVVPGGLKPYAVRRVIMGDSGVTNALLEVTCPRKDCSGMFWVRPRWRLRKHPKPGSAYKTRPCPYCFRVSLISTKSKETT